MTLSEFLRWQRHQKALLAIVERFIEIDQALEMNPGHGIAESILGGIFEDIETGNFDRITEVWVFDGGEEWAAQKLANLAAMWKEAARAPFHLSFSRDLRLSETSDGTATCGSLRKTSPPPSDTSTQTILFE